ncbi:dihydrolipoamide acetyltransferase [Porphyromonas sp. COT-290 OH3588]|uniref:dihydrolipoamide acetyltransferase n=1 Tax=Porphyromonas sp. COT-290 OH3588 TaxID=1515617 RepID=UPI00052C88B6|nr:dihydrolipoamide acetyltransferase [Porphyromonas sp. COT-290 OH3588]KGO00856.1 dihydrolipoamide acetyltransferase [Porphyromonas sp. COT-290 OH3588]
MENEKLRATPAARSLAHRMGIELNQIVGSGYKGRIHREDVANFTYIERAGVTPLARKIAEAHNINVEELKGTGFRGKVTRADVLAAVGETGEPNLERILDAFTIPSPERKKTNFATPGKNEAPEMKAPAAASAAAPSASAEPKGDVEIVPMNMMRRVIAKRMSESYFSAPTFVLNYEVDMGEASKLRAQLMEPIKEKTGKKLTVTDIVSLAVVRTLMNHPYINASLSPDGSQIELHNYVNLAMAVGMDEGLLVPVVHRAEKMGLTELMLRLKDITERAVGKKLTPADQEGSTFTISNLGMYGVESFTSIINQPNSAILSIAGTKEMPVVRNGEVVIRPIMKMSLTSDHRVINGLAAAKFMQELKATLENPLPLLV